MTPAKKGGAGNLRDRRRDARAGLTLVEVLVAVTLLALLAGGMTTALSMGAGAWSQVRERLVLDRKIASFNQLLHAHFAAVVPVTARPPRRVGVGEAPFFHGEPQQMRFVSSYSLADGVRGGLRIVELNVMRAKKGLRLVLTESAYRGPASVGRYIIGSERVGRGVRLLFQPVTPREDSMIVADQLGRVEFSYLHELPNSREPAEWTSIWADARQIPAAIQVVMEPARREPRLQPVSIVAQVRPRYAPPSEAGGQVQGIDMRNVEVVDLGDGRTALRARPR